MAERWALCLTSTKKHRNHVWSYDLVGCYTDEGKTFPTLSIILEFNRECWAIRVKRKLNSAEDIDALTDLFILRGVLGFIQSNNGPKLIALAVRD